MESQVFFYFLFGRPSYLFPVMLAYAGWLVHKEQALPDARLAHQYPAAGRGLRADPGHELRSRDAALERGRTAQ